MFTFKSIGPTAMTRVIAVAFILAFAWVPEADAQTRCDGFPPAGGGRRQLATLLGYAGQSCSGELFPIVGGRKRGRGRLSGGFATFGAGAAVEDIQVVRGPAHGSFRMTGSREFTYTPGANMRGWDRIVVRFILDSRRGRMPGVLVFRATTREWYDANGGREAAER